MPRTLVLGMKMRRRVIGVVHADIDAKKIGYDGHFSFLIQIILWG